MPVYAATESIDYAMHGSRFAAFVNPGRGSTQLCAWRLSVPPNAAGVAHRPSREEVLLVLDGTLRFTLGADTTDLSAGDVAHVPAGSLIRIDSGPSGASAWVTSTPGLTARTEDGTTIAPPWAQ